MVGKNSSRRVRSGIYPLTVKLVLVAVALAISIAIASYVFSLIISTREYFELKPMLYVTQAGIEPAPVLTIYTLNDGAKSEILLKVEIITGAGNYICNVETPIEAGFRGYIILIPRLYQGPLQRSERDKVVECDWNVYGSPQITEGNFYVVKLYTARHGVLTLNILCQKT
ncbi:MAG: hypothetical protein RMI56_01060 [Sulfolobales archaeon]|nr:hypothetical protein [Sulfolobales archaeon]MDW8082369.1 hypothetical protein [Sulfolobales archaeon]